MTLSIDAGSYSTTHNEKFGPYEVYCGKGTQNVDENGVIGTKIEKK